jgi:hypothetical protein
LSDNEGIGFEDSDIAEQSENQASDIDDDEDFDTEQDDVSETSEEDEQQEEDSDKDENISVDSAKSPPDQDYESGMPKEDQIIDPGSGSTNLTSAEGSG